jgi:hypothetical protein
VASGSSRANSARGELGPRRSPSAGCDLKREGAGDCEGDEDACRMGEESAGVVGPSPSLLPQQFTSSGSELLVGLKGQTANQTLPAEIAGRLMGPWSSSRPTW